jgi:hypothetical protein
MFYYIFVLFQHLVDNREKGRENERRQEPLDLELLDMEVLESSRDRLECIDSEL